MVGIYDVRLGDRLVGRMEVTQEGLYYRFSCRCRIPEGQVHRLGVRCGGGYAELGVCVPVEGGFGLERRLKCKQFPPGRPEFQLYIGHQRPGKIFVPVYPEEPFSYLSRMKDAFLEIREGQMGVVIPEKMDG